MAEVQVKFDAPANVGGQLLENAKPAAANVEDITSSGASQATTAESPNEYAYVAITSSGGAVWAKIAAVPVAAAGDQHLIADGQTRFFGGLAAGDKVAVIDV